MMQQFKIGDWVDYAGNLYRVHEKYNGKGNISKEVVNTLVRHNKNVKLWLPKEGEWVWCRNGCDSAYIIQYKIVNYDIEYEPFIGELPTFLQRV